MHSLNLSLTVNRELVAVSHLYIAAAVSPSTTVSFSPFSHSKTTNEFPAIESPAVLTGDEVGYCFDSLRVCLLLRVTSGNQSLGHEPPGDHDEAITEPLPEDSLLFLRVGHD